MKEARAVMQEDWPHQCMPRPPSGA